MITLFRGPDTYTIDEAKTVMMQQIKEMPNKVSYIGEPKQLIRFEFMCEPLDLLGWMHNQSFKERIYWSDRGESFEMVGLGVADMITGRDNDYSSVIEQMEDRLSDNNPYLRYYGGFCFHPDAVDEQWSDFGAYRFVIPRFELIRQNGKTIFAFNTKLEDVVEENIESIVKELDKVVCESQTKYRKVPELIERMDEPNEEQWPAMFNQIHDGHKCLYEKVVLARKSTFKFNVKIRPSALMKHLKDQTANCFHFCIQADEHVAFLGATPERLFRKSNKSLSSEAVAGTTHKGQNEEEIQQLEHDLLHSDKYIQEHRYVHDAIADVFQNLCQEYHCDKTPSLLKLLNGQHLVTKFQGTLKDSCELDSILKELHPTPAVGGKNKEQSIKIINDIEPFSRGWYAGPIGYVGYQEAEFAVGIRSGLVSDDKLLLFAGAGIVDGSKQKEEWDEIENKISRFMKVFK